MFSQKRLIVAIRVASTLALLVSVMSPPLRGSSSPAVRAVRPDCLCGNLAIPQTHLPLLRTKLIISRVAPVKAIRSETEGRELDRDSSEILFFVGFPPSSSLQTPTRNPANFGLARAHIPLRC